MLRLTDVVRATGGAALGASSEIEFSGVSTDTRALGPGALFVALRGPRHDAHDFLPEAARRGAAGLLVERPPAGLPASGAPIAIRVPDSRRALGELARFHALRSRATRVAITGSNGKTTTKELLHAALGAGGETIASPRSFNNDVGVPLTLLSIGPSTRYAVVEVGTNAPGEVARLADLVRPHHAIVTQCAAAHVLRLGSLDGVVREKGALIEALPPGGAAILNADDPSHRALRERAPGRVTTFGIRQSAEWRAVDVRFDLRRLVYRRRGARVSVPRGGCHTVNTARAANAAADAAGVPWQAAAAALRRVEGPPMRLRPIAAAGVTIVDDSWNSNPGSVEAALRTLAALPRAGRRVVVLGDMLELGAHAAALHREAGERMGLLPDALLVAVGAHASEVADGARARGIAAANVVVSDSAAEAAAIVPGLLRDGDTLLVKGSRGMRMEVVVDAVKDARSGIACKAAGAGLAGA